MLIFVPRRLADRYAVHKIPIKIPWRWQSLYKNWSLPGRFEKRMLTLARGIRPPPCVPRLPLKAYTARKRMRDNEKRDKLCLRAIASPGACAVRIAEIPAGESLARLSAIAQKEKVRGMQSRIVSGIKVIFDPGEQETAGWICDTAAGALCLVQESWGLGRPEDCRIHVMTSWLGFFFQSAPPPWRILLALTFPLWCFRARRTWPFSGAWTQRYGRRVAIGIKPPRLLEASNKSIGMHMFVEEKEAKTKVQHLACHELTHACSAHLRLPAWLNEGLAAVTVDRYLRKRTIRTDTLELVRSFEPKGRPPTYRELSRMSGKAIAYHAVRGYWLVQYLEEKRPGFLRQRFSSPQAARKIEDEVPMELGMEPDGFWNKIDDRMAAQWLAAPPVS